VCIAQSLLHLPTGEVQEMPTMSILSHCVSTTLYSYYETSCKSMNIVIMIVPEDCFYNLIEECYIVNEFYALLCKDVLLNLICILSL